MSYQLMAVDLDGTLLNAQKKISAQDAEAINRALEAGKQIVFSTGRCMGELRHLLPAFPKLRYVFCSSGVCIMDIWKNQAMVQKSMDRSVAEQLLYEFRSKDILTIIFMNGQAVISQKDIDNMAHYQMSQYQEHFQTYGMPVENVYQFYWEHRLPVEKINLFHTSAEAAGDTIIQLRGLPLTATKSEGTALELTAENTDKGACLADFCTRMQIPLEETIVIGDSANDLCAMEKAGLSIAMGNAPKDVKAACDAVVTDNNHGGVSEAVDTYLLQ